MVMTLGMVTFDTTDANRLADWWAEQTGGEVVERNDGWFAMVAVPSLPVRLAFQKVADPTPGKNRVHLDLEVSDPRAAVAELVAAGATRVADHGEPDGFSWTVLADPHGNQFCVSAEHTD